jgi:phosphomannomutase
LVADLPRYTMVKDQYPLSAVPEDQPRQHLGAAEANRLWDRIALAFPDAKQDRRDGLRLEWDDRWVHIRSSNTEPIVRVIAEAGDPAIARELTLKVGHWVSSPSGGHHE